MSPPLPGSWQADGNSGFAGDFEQDNIQPAERPTAKRRQTDKDSWVMVGSSDLDGGDSPKRKVSSSASIPTKQDFSAPPRPTASRASSRRSLIPTPSRKHSYTASTSNTSAHSPFGDHARRASVANPRSPPVRHRSNSYGFPRPATPNSPSYLSPEAERYARRNAKRDRVADTAMNNMGRNIQDLIRQAQEALGTKYSVEGEAADVDEGFVDEDW
ncbi:hypothetical protein K431DRAFT_287479 [Polychaeton citri CBS 116435]|uniref:Uncharacterized protein n=1 Tax=Polychaeton citri CBS 116435 TaxID=1314669 RepID=A0A9P4Q102_9PEZI|nr:hypothetical protein K431DRAFT_287479 [Polychaeton citri CBS 116435]